MDVTLSDRQARLLALLIRSHLGLGIYQPKRTEEIDAELTALLPTLERD